MDKKKASEEPVYVISVAARLADVHPQTLRIYERKGLINPVRVHNRRRYSESDIEQCRLIQELTQEMGVNLAGVKMILDLRKRMENMKRSMNSMEEEIAGLQKDMEERINQARIGLRNDIMHVPRGEIALPNISDPFAKLRLRRG